ncbi:MAG: F0F1 ATP synthase subunit B [Candidatus Levyibacteriota bacterium]
MEIIKNFGVEPMLLAAQIVNFLIILFILKKFLYKPVLETLKKREKSIKEGLNQAEEGKIALEKALEEEKKILKKAQVQARKIIDDAKNQSGLLAKGIEENAKNQSKKILEDAKNQIGEDTKEAEKRLTAKINSISIEILQKALKEMFSEKDEKKLIEKAIKQIVK